MKTKQKKYTTRIPIDYLLPEERLVGEPVRIIGHVIIDRKIFQKSPEEKLRLKIEKAKLKRLIKN